VKLIEPCSLFKEAPNADDEAAMDEEVVDRFRVLFAKRTKPTIWPPSLGQPVGRPNPSLVDKPCKKFHLWWCPCFPYCLVHRRDGGSDEVQLISRLGRVLPIRRKLPRDVVLHLRVKVDVRDKG
jgi:hypothetical protein